MIGIINKTAFLWTDVIGVIVADETSQYLCMLQSSETTL
jgi:hypothetical protein